MQNQVPAVADPGRTNNLRTRLVLERRFSNSINWFYWIACLAIISTVVFFSGYALAFIIGLAATQFIDLQLSQAAAPLRVLGVIIDLVISGLFFLFGYLGRKKDRRAIVTGMIVYAADAILLLRFQDWLGVAFHAWGLFSIWGGLKALGQLEALNQPAAEITPRSSP